MDLKPPLYRQIGMCWRRTSGQPPAHTSPAELIRDVIQQEFRDSVILIF
ncbi:MAG: hypothetical protein HRU31_08650 [Rhodobacteraceae bacterium]|nr:hypothetical protein [Paracoccaceae bacterium]